MRPRVNVLAPARRIKRLLAKRRFYASIRPSDVFLVAYPKSGTTWLGFMVANFLKRNPNEEVNLAAEGYIPDINSKYGKHVPLRKYDSIPSPRFFRVHASYDASLPKVVYVLRDPRDALVSYWHFKKLVDRNGPPTIKELVRTDDDWVCSWDQHVAGWLFEHQHPQLLVVRYEDMHRNAAAALKAVLDFAGLPCRPADIESAVEASRFENMRKAEEKFGLGTPVADPTERFVRRGKIGSWKEELTGDDLRALEERFGETMVKVGYHPVTG